MLTLHIGLPKTGTTYLQRSILGKAQDVMLVHRLTGPQAQAICLDLRRYVRTNAVFATALHVRFGARLGRLAAQAEAERRILVASAENISVHPRDFWQNTNPPPEKVARRLRALADRNPALAPVRVIIGLRGQDQWLASRYAESSKDLPWLSQADFDRRLTAIAGSRDLPGALAWLDYHHVYTTFAEALGPQNLHIYWLEGIAAAPARTIARIGHFIGGPALADDFHRLAGGRRRRPTNVLSTGDNVWRLRSGNAELRLDPGLQGAVVSRFRDSNRALQALLAAS